MALTLILGGARSGKSDLAQRLAAASGRPVLFVATMEPGDEEMRARIAVHRAERPAAWRTVEEPLDIVGALEREARAGDFVVLDCVTLWVSNLLGPAIADVDRPLPKETDAAMAAVRDATAALLDWHERSGADLAAVSNEVGMGVVPAYPLGRIFRDALGAANATLAARASAVYFLAAGMALELKSLGARPLDAFGPDAEA